MKKRFEPLQYNFQRHWHEEIRPILKTPAVVEALNRIIVYREDFAEFKMEEHLEADPEQAKAEYLLDIHTAHVMCRNLSWLREELESCDLVGLSYAIATTLYPNQTWEDVEQDEYAVVTNSERTLVFDMKNFDRLSAGASLVIANDPKFTPSDRARLEADQFLENRLQGVLESLSIARAHLAEHDKEETPVLSFEKQPD